MKKLSFFCILLITQIIYAQSEALIFDVTSAQPTITITPKVSFYYPTAGIKITSSGFNLQNQSVNCSSTSNGYCIFGVGPNNPKTFTISGNGALTYILCTNGIAPGINCQNYSADFSGGPTPVFRKAYVTDLGNDTIYTCNVNESGAAISCSNASFTGATPGFTLPTGIVYNSAQDKVYVGDNGNTNVYTCDLNASSEVTSCGDAVLIGNSASDITLNSAQNKAYVVSTSGDTVYTCDINSTTGVITSCSNAPFAGGGGATPALVLAAGIGYNTAQNKAYVVDYGNDNVYTCDIDGAGDLTSCTNAFFTGATPVFSHPDQIGINPAQNKAYVADSSNNNVYTCDIDAISGAVTSCTTALFTGATPAFSSPIGAAFNEDDNKVYVTDAGNDTLYTCDLDINGNLTSCTNASFNGATPGFSTPIGVTMGS